MYDKGWEVSRAFHLLPHRPNEQCSCSKYSVGLSGNRIEELTIVWVAKLLDLLGPGLGPGLQFYLHVLSPTGCVGGVEGCLVLF